MKLSKLIIKFLNKIIMALENKKLSSYDDISLAGGISSTTKIVGITGSTARNVNIPVSDLVKDTLSSASTLTALSSAKGKLLDETKATKADPAFTGTVGVTGAAINMGTTGTITAMSSTISASEIACLDTVTTNIQTQIDAKAPIDNPTFTSTVDMSGATSVKVPTPATTSNTTVAASTEFVKNITKDKLDKYDAVTNWKASNGRTHVRTYTEGGSSADVLQSNISGAAINSIEFGDVDVDTIINGKNIIINAPTNTTLPTGTVSKSSTSGTLVGVGTNFTEFNANDTITVNGNTWNINSISNDLGIIVSGDSSTFTDKPYTITRNANNNHPALKFQGYNTDNTNNIFYIGGHILPNDSGNSLYNIGSSSNRWNDIYNWDGVIGASDARLKTEISQFTTDELNAAKQLSKEIGTYKWLSAIAQKGDAARKHIGMTVQRAIEIMTANNLNPFDYGFICYSEWQDEFETIPAIEAVDAWVEEIKDENGIVIDTIEHPAIEAKDSYQVQTKVAGSIYSFRYTELLAFIARGFEERLTALENK